MKDTLSFEQEILNAAQSLTPIDGLNKVKLKIEKAMSLPDGYFERNENGKLVLTITPYKEDYRKELSNNLHMVKTLLKYFTNRIDDNNKSFNKYLLFSNIRELLKTSSLKIGQIEKESGVQSGYMSRLEKFDNTTEPTIEFLMTASMLLKVSIDSLVSYDFHSLTETELYLLKVIDKFRMDTINGKLDWQIEASDILNEGLSDDTAIQHPLFETHEVYFDEKSDYPEAHRITSFNSMAYGPTTSITGDCYNLSLKNYSKIYIMNIEKLTTRWGEESAFSKEIWLVKYDNKKECLVSEKNTPVLTEAVELLYKEIGNYVIRPKLKKDTRKILDGFLMDDFTVDDDCEIPF